MLTDIPGSIARVTGANRGIGRHLATQLLQSGAAEVYATTRHPERVHVPGAGVLALDITEPASMAAAACTASRPCRRVGWRSSSMTGAA